MVRKKEDAKIEITEEVSQRRNAENKVIEEKKPINIAGKFTANEWANMKKDDIYMAAMIESLIPELMTEQEYDAAKKELHKPTFKF